MFGLNASIIIRPEVKRQKLRVLPVRIKVLSARRSARKLMLI